MTSEPERKGLRFEVYQFTNQGGDGVTWTWQMVGADGLICYAASSWDTEKECRSSLASNKGRLGNAKRAKVITVGSP